MATGEVTSLLCSLSANSVRHTLNPPTWSQFVEDIPGAWNGTWLEQTVTSWELAGTATWTMYPRKQKG